MYDEVRRPRAQAVWEGSLNAGKVYDGHGKSGPSPEGLRKDFDGLQDFVWGHHMDDDVQRACTVLHERGVFPSATLPPAFPVE